MVRNLEPSFNNVRINGINVIDQQALIMLRDTSTGLLPVPIPARLFFFPLFFSFFFFEGWANRSKGARIGLNLSLLVQSKFPKGCIDFHLSQLSASRLGSRLS